MRQKSEKNQTGRSTTSARAVPDGRSFAPERRRRRFEALETAAPGLGRSRRASCCVPAPSDREPGEHAYPPESCVEPLTRILERSAGPARQAVDRASPPAVTDFSGDPARREFRTRDRSGRPHGDAGAEFARCQRNLNTASTPRNPAGRRNPARRSRRLPRRCNRPGKRNLQGAAGSAASRATPRARRWRPPTQQCGGCTADCQRHRIAGSRFRTGRTEARYRHRHEDKSSAAAPHGALR